ncbi:MAG: hypothetical protein ACPGJV_10395 [Bacteriovoracaceae bacterium]
MFPQGKKLASGKIKYYIRYKDPDTGRYKYLDSKQYPDNFYTFEDCKEWINTNRHRFSHLKYHADVLRDLKAKQKFPSFQKMVDMFEATQKEEAPNSWQTSMLYIDRFIIPFFHLKKGLRDINTWKDYFEEYRDWLLNEATIKGKDQLISYSTKNHAIRTLNKFLTVMMWRKKLRKENYFKCRSFPRSLQNTRGLEAVFSDDEYELLLENLKEETKEFFQILYHSGMRFNELYSLPMESVMFPEEIPDYLKKRFQNYPHKVYGCLTLIDQLAEGKKVKDKRLHIGASYKNKRKALKGYKGKPKADHQRIIPILCKATWQLIEENYHRAWDEFDFHSGLPNRSKQPNDYFLLRGLENPLRRDFFDTLNRLKIKNKNFHSCRHTRITFWVGRDLFDPLLVRTFSGHRGDSFEKYLHIWEQMTHDTKKKKNISGKRRKPKFKLVG